MVPGEWRICMNCKGTLRGLQGGKYTEYECRACHEELPEHRFDAERLHTWVTSRHHEQIVCLQCAPTFAVNWWQKKADGGKYTCSVCSEALPRLAYSKEGFSKPDALICKECNRAELVRPHLKQKSFNCAGSCKRQQLTQDIFTVQMLLKRIGKEWGCKECEFPRCEHCQLRSDRPVPFGADAKKEAAKTKGHQRHWICEWCLYPPCAGCGLKRTRGQKRKDIQLELWFCRKCFGQAAEKTEQQHPPCSGCGVKKRQSLQKSLHEHRAWRCSACWRKADS